MEVKSNISEALTQNENEGGVELLRDNRLWELLGSTLQAQRTGSPIIRGSSDFELPLSSGQKRFWFIQHSDPQNVAYNLAFSWRLTGRLNVTAIEQSINAIVQRHDIFRTTFSSRSGRVMQTIHPLGSSLLSIVDLDFLLEPEREAEACRQCAAEGKKPFDLATGPLLRVSLFRLGAEQHILFFAVHHIAFDGVSLGIFYRELQSFYRAFSERKQCVLPELTVRYADYAAWEEEFIASQSFEKQLSFWKEQLKGKLPLLELPADRPRPPVQTFRGALHHFQIGREVAAILDTFRRQENVSLFVITLAAFKALLFRYTGQEDLVVGSLVSNRHRSELRNLFGFFVNTQMVRSSIHAGLTFRELVAQVNENSLAALAHADVPFDRIVEALKPDRDPSHTPLFQSLYSFHSLPRKALELQGLKVQQLPVDTGASKFDLSLDVNELADGLSGSFEYNSDLFDRETIARMAGHFQSLIAAAAQDPSRPISALPLLSEVERQQILVQWNNTEAEYPRQACIHTLFEQRVLQSPDAVALEFEGARMSYSELDQKANRLANYLRSLGVGLETMVGLCIERSFEMVVAMLAILKAGGAYVPLDPAFPPDRLAFMIEDSQMPLLLTKERLQKFLPKNAVRMVCLDLQEGTLANFTTEPLLPLSTSESLAYILYTSGSTGKPKGVQIIHSAVVNFLLSMRRAPGLSREDVLLAITTLSFDIAGLEIFLPLITGARGVIAPREVAGDGTLLSEQIEQSAITVMQATPATWRLLLQSGWQGCPRLKILCGGEALTQDLADALLPRCAELWNLYGPTETTIWSSAIQVRTDDPIVVGPPIANTQLYVVDERLEPVPIGVPGELCIGGDGLARGYLNRPELTAEKFVPNPFCKAPGQKIYLTGDLVRFRRDGNIEFLGRKDNQVKVRGYRIELGEIESVLAQHPDVQQNVVVAREDAPGEKRLVAYVIPKEKQTTSEDLRRWLLESLPEYMLPSAFVTLESFPLTPNGKVDRRSLPAPDFERPQLEAIYEAPRTETEQTIVRIWQEVLNLEKVGIHDNFFELGGYSLLLVKVHTKLREAFSKSLLMVEMFRYPTVNALANFFHETHETKPAETEKKIAAKKQHTPRQKNTSESSVAIVGLAGRFPGAKNVDEFWKNLREGVESISQFTDEELLAKGVSSELLINPNYVKAGAVIDGFDQFDAAFFGINPKEAEVIDPQQRLFLETAWEGLECAGCNPENFPGRIGVFAGASMNTYLLNWGGNSRAHNPSELFQAMIGNDKDYLATRLSYKLNLRGPSFTVQTACSTSLVAVHLACKSLLNDECDMALAGGVCANAQQGTGYLSQEGMILSPDGHCRAFDEKAHGTIIGMGIGLVALKRLSDAIDDGDTIHAVIRGTAINNDGGEKMGYTAPSSTGQGEVVAMAQASAGVDPETISYVEAHGTGTSLGDPIEIAGLTEAFRLRTKKKQFCAVGSVKSNVGHLDVAAGVAGLIKTVFALKNKQIPPSLHFETPNPKIDFQNSPFYVNAQLQDWKSNNGLPRRAGVSSFGIGGTNAHAVLEESPPAVSSETTRPYQLLLVSAKTDSAVQSASANLGKFFEQEDNIADASYTLQTGRKHFNRRAFSVAANRIEAVDSLREIQQMALSPEEPRERKIVFLFTGQGSQHVKMGMDLYEHEEVFRLYVDECSELLQPELGCDLRQLLFHSDPETATQQLNQTALAQPALFTIEYALAQLWMSWGVKPEAMMGHSIGEYVAACVAGVFSLRDALHLVAERGRLMQEMPHGSMLAVPLSQKDVQPFLSDDLVLAASNGPCLSVISGPTEALDDLAADLLERGLNCKRLHTSHAFHSPMMEPILQPFTNTLQTMKLSPPSVRFVSNLTGTWIKTAEATNPAYWAKHLRNTVRFSQGIQELIKDPDRVFLEVGPGQTLSALTKLHSRSGTSLKVLSSLRHVTEEKSDEKHILTSLGHLWMLGVSVDWTGFYRDEKRLRIPLPTYPFERQRYWLDAPKSRVKATSEARERAPLDQWFYTPSWKRSHVDRSSVQQATKERAVWLVFADRCGVGESLARQLKQVGQVVTLVTIGKTFAKTPDSNFFFNPDQSDDYKRLFEALVPMGRLPSRIVHLWSITVPGKKQNLRGQLESSLERNFYSFLHIAQGIRQHMPDMPVQLKIISNQLQEVTGEESVRAEKALVLGPCFAIPQENKNVQCSSIDVILPESVTAEEFNELLLDELFATTRDPVVAHRGGYRWVQLFEPATLNKSDDAKPVLRQHGVYLITGGLGGIGSVLAEHLAQACQAKLILTARTSIPDRAQWKAWLETHEESDSLSGKIRKIENLEKLGAEVLLLDADVADAERMKNVVVQAEARFGKLNGIIHAAGIAGGGLIELKTREAAAEILSPKVYGTIALHEALQNRTLDFLVLCSSVNALVGDPGQIDYAAANAFLDAYARQHHGRNVFAINWYPWQEVGMAANIAVPQNLLAEREITMRLGVRPADGVEVFRRILEYRMPQVIVSPENFNSFVELQNAGFELDAVETGKSTQKYTRPEMVSSYVEPRTKLEKSLAEMWQEVLGIDKVGVEDDFFQLGGHSLLALTLTGKTKKLTGKDLPLSVFFEAPTIGKLAALLGDEKRTATGAVEGSRSQIIVPIKPSGTRPPFFCIHGVGGAVLEYSHLARYLDADQPLYGIQAQGVDGKEFWLKTIDEMVERYLKEIKIVQPKGPYYLGGSSFGGLIAFEMAKRLHAAGERVPLLAFFDSYGKNYPTPLPARNRFQAKVNRELARMDLHLTNLRSMQAKDWPDYLREKASRLPLRFSRKTKQLKQDFRFLFLPRALRNQFKWTGDDGGDMWHFKLPKAYSQIADLNVKSCLGYQFKPYPGNAVLFRASKQPPGIKSDPSNGWSELIQGNLQIIDVAGYHGAMIREPLVRGLASQFNRVLSAL